MPENILHFFVLIEDTGVATYPLEKAILQNKVLRKKGHCDAVLVFSANCMVISKKAHRTALGGVSLKKWSSHRARHCVSKKKNVGIICHFMLLKMLFHTCEKFFFNSVKCFTLFALFCTCREDWLGLMLWLEFELGVGLRLGLR